jgi:hypothetical protein
MGLVSAVEAQDISSIAGPSSVHRRLPIEKNEQNTPAIQQLDRKIADDISESEALTEDENDEKEEEEHADDTRDSGPAVPAGASVEEDGENGPISEFDGDKVAATKANDKLGFNDTTSSPGIENQNVTMAPDIKIIRGNITHPNIVWLMSFPNSGTSFTIHMTREASNSTTATNYAGEGDIKDLPSTQVIDGADGEEGPFLELIRGRYTNVPRNILTKTHCTGFCSNCGPYKLLFETPRSFMRGCLSGSRTVHGKHGLETIDTIYDPALVTKAIHIFRHPLDNTVARFHLEYNEEQAAGNAKYVEQYPKNASGFQAWCARSDKKLDLFETRYIDDALKAKMRAIPCFNEFFKYVQWHNMAFYTTHEMDLEVLYMHYNEYEEDFETARDKVLKFLELPLVGLGIEFLPGKVYRHYYSTRDKLAIRQFIEEYASRDTWNMVKDYDFEITAADATS